MELTAGIIIALVQAFGPGAVQLIDTFMKDKNTVYTPEMWDALKTPVPFVQLAGPK